MKSMTGISLLATGVLLVACNGKDDTPPPPPPPPPAALNFNSYVTTMATSTNRDADSAVDVDALTFTFNNDDESAFSTLFP